MKEFIAEISSRKNVKRKDLLEKDILIQKILLDLSKDEFFSKNLAFKGGTCLIKCYLGYFRFSEDIDFTWIDQSRFKDQSSKQIRKIISEIKDKIGEILENISKKRGLDFVLDKNNKKYVEFGGGNKIVTFKIWYRSEILKELSFIKIQINFVEDIKFKISKKNVGCLLKDKDDKELEVLFEDDYNDYSSEITLYTYDVKEILCEKVRAILTRRGIKARDFVDLCLIGSSFHVDVKDFMQEIIDKTKFMIEQYKKYQDNINEKLKLLSSKDFFQWGTEKELLLKTIDEKKFNRFVQELQEVLKDIGKEFV